MKTTAVLSFAAMFVCAALVIQCSDGGTVVEVDEGDGAATVRDSGGTGQSDAGSGGGRDTGAEDAVASDGGTGDAGHEDGGTGDAGTADDFGLVDGGADAGTLCGRNGGYCAASADACDSGFVDGPVLGCPGGKCCLPAKTDAGSGDGGTADSGSADTGAVDAGSADTGAPDSGTTDAGVSDGGAVDAGPAGTSRFGIGIHSPRSDLNAQIVDLGDIYVRLNLWDVAGWQNIKSQAMIAECEYCCDPVRSLNCSCAPGPNYCCAQGKYYFCTPASRNDRVEGEANADTFYGLQHDILFSVGPGAYGSTQPKSIADLNSEEYPANEQTYREYIQYLVQQYPDVIYWEMGNEANYSAFWGDTPENYARFVTLSSTEIKNLCPGCKVGISLTNPDPGASWFNAITGVCDDIDFLDLHHYQSSTMSELALFETSSLTAWKASCPGKEIISTETGLPSVPVTFKGETWQLGKNETEQGQDIIKYFTMMFNAGYGKIYNYLIDHDFVAGEADIFESIGVLRMDGTKKVSFTTYLVMISKLDHFVSVARLSAGQYKYTFTHKNPVFVLWCDSGSCALTSEVSGTVKITDYLGNEQTMSSGQIVLTRSPVFVEGN